MKKAPRKSKKDIPIFSARQVDQIVEVTRADAFKKGKESCANDHLTVTATVGELEPNKTYCFVRVAPLEIQQPKASLGFGA